jgi:outer membrane protein assembly factor BamA
VPGLFFNALSNNVKVAGGGAYVEYDGRDDESGLTQGVYVYGRFGVYESFGSRNLLALTDYGWAETEVDVRGYVPLGSRKTSLALRTYADLRNPKDGKQVPVYEMPWLGGRNHLRGYQNFRFRGNNLLLLIGELRQTVWAQKETRGVDLFVFVDNGKVWGDSRSATNPLIVRNDKFGDQPLRVQPGFGFQYRYNKGFAARFDIAKSNERTMVYFSVSRGF